MQRQIIEISDKLRIINNGCVDELKSYKDESVDVFVCSPPYNQKKQYLSYSDDLPESDYLNWTVEWATEVKRLLKPNGSFFLNIGSSNVNPFLAQNVCSVLLNLFVLQNNIIWIKNISIDDESFGHFKPINSKRYLNNCWESIFHFTKTGNVTIERLAVGVPYRDKTNITRWKHNPIDLRCAGNCWFLPYKTVTSKKDHPAGYPVELPLRCIKLHGVCKDMLVVDPFLGGGSTLEACALLGVNGIGIELDAEYCKIAQERCLKQT